jgi:hypothetical protein
VLQLLFALVLCYGVKLAPARGAAASGVAALRGNHEAPIHAGESLAPAPGGSRRRQLAHEVVGHLVEGVRARKEAELAAMAAVVAQDDAEKRRQLEEADTRGLPPPRIEGWERTEAGTWARTVYYPAIDGGDFDVQAAREAGQVARFLASESCPDMTEHGWGGKAVRGTLPRLDELRGRVEARLAAGQLPNLKDCLAALYGGWMRVRGVTFYVNCSGGVPAGAAFDAACRPRMPLRCGGAGWEAVVAQQYVRVTSYSRCLALQAPCQNGRCCAPNITAPRLALRSLPRRSLHIPQEAWRTCRTCCWCAAVAFLASRS